MIVEPNTLAVEAAAAKDPTKYMWFKFTGKRASAKLEDGTKLPISEGERYGVKVSKDTIFILLESDMTRNLKMAYVSSVPLLKNSVPYKGKVNKIKVEPGSKALVDSKLSRSTNVRLKVMLDESDLKKRARKSRVSVQYAGKIKDKHLYTIGGPPNESAAMVNVLKGMAKGEIVPKKAASGKPEITPSPKPGWDALVLNEDVEETLMFHLNSLANLGKFTRRKLKVAREYIRSNRRIIKRMAKTMNTTELAKFVRNAIG